MDDIQEKIISSLREILNELGEATLPIEVAIPQDLLHGDFTTNLAFHLSKSLKKSPLMISQEIVARLQAKNSKNNIEKIEAISPGFINFWVSKGYLISQVAVLLKNPKKIGYTKKLLGKKIMVEYAHPNTHKEAHIGHTRTLITGEAIARILEANGAVVFRANYQGDIGPHVAKAVYGIITLLKEQKRTLEMLATWSNKDKVHFLGQAYARGNNDYDREKKLIDHINKLIYNHGQGDAGIWNIYEKTRQWSLDYYDDLYRRFSVRFDHLFFETEMAEDGLKIVRENIGKVFTQNEDGSVIFLGEKFGLHTRVFITRAGTPTYEGKEMANAFREAKEFPFDKKIHVVGSEQEGYFQVIFKALELINPTKFVGKQQHLPTGIIQLKDRKMSSRTGDILTYDTLIEEIKSEVAKLIQSKNIDKKEKEELEEKIALAAIKYSVLHVNTRQNVSFDIEKSISIEGDSGPYILYAYARTQSILKKNPKNEAISNTISTLPGEIQAEEAALLRFLYQFSSIVEASGAGLEPHILCSYLYQLAKIFNIFYQKVRILDAKSAQERQVRIMLVELTATVISNGLYLLGIATTNKM